MVALCVCLKKKAEEPQETIDEVTEVVAAVGKVVDGAVVEKKAEDVEAKDGEPAETAEVKVEVEAAAEEGENEAEKKEEEPKEENTEEAPKVEEEAAKEE